MIISEKQILCLLDILKDSIKIGVEISGQFIISHEQRRDLYQDIISQQSEKLIEIKDE